MNRDKSTKSVAHAGLDGPTPSVEASVEWEFEASVE
jgi:hypothetical protein